VVAIGGISVANLTPLALAGVDAVAVISALYSGPDVRQQAEAIVRSFLDADRVDDAAGEAS